MREFIHTFFARRLLVARMEDAGIQDNRRPECKSRYTYYACQSVDLTAEILALFRRCATIGLRIPKMCCILLICNHRVAL